MAVLGKTVNRKNSTKIGFIIILIICIVIVRKSGFINETTIDKMKTFINSYGLYAPLIYIFTIGIVSNLFVPMSILIITGGLMFGAIGGFLYSLIGSTLSVFLGYIFYNDFGIKDTKYLNGKIGHLFNRIQNRGLLLVIIIRLLAIPFASQNIIGSILNIPFRSYFIGSVIGMTPWLIGFSFFGDSIIKMKYHFIILSGLLLLFLY